MTHMLLSMFPHFKYFTTILVRLIEYFGYKGKDIYSLFILTSNVHFIYNNKCSFTSHTIT